MIKLVSVETNELIIAQISGILVPPNKKIFLILKIFCVFAFEAITCPFPSFGRLFE